MGKNSRKKSLAMKASALLAATTLVFAPLNASAAGLNLGGLVGGVLGTTTGLVGDVVNTATGVVGGVVNTVGGVVADPVGTVGAVVSDPVGTVNGVVKGIVPENAGIAVELPVGSVEVLKDGGVADVDLLSGKDNGNAGKEGLANVDVALNHVLTASAAKVDPSTKSLTLSYSSEGVLDLKALSEYKVVFKMPEEFNSLLKEESFKKALTGTYNFEAAKVLGINVGSLLPIVDQLLGAKGTFTNDQIVVDPATNTISMNVKSLLGLNVLSTLNNEVTLTIPLDKLPCALDNEYTFTAYASEGLVNVALLEEFSAPVNVAVEYGDNNPCVKPEQPKEDPKTPEGPKVDNNTKDDGEKLPVTATGLGNMALIGLLTLLAGFVVRFITRKTA